MKITIKRSELLRALGVFKRFVDGRAAAAHRTIWFSSHADRPLVVSMQDKNDVYLSTNVPVLEFEREHKAENEAAFAGAVFKPFYKMLRYAPDAVTLELDPDLPNIRISFPGGSLACVTMDRAWRPQPALLRSGSAVGVEALAVALESVYRSASDDKTMDALSCVRLRSRGQDGLLAEALNGHQYQNALVADTDTSCTGWAGTLPKDGILLRRTDVARLIPLLRSDFLGDNPVAHVEEKTAERYDKVNGTTITEKSYVRLYLRGSRGVVSLTLGRYSYPNTDDFVAKGRAASNSLTTKAGEMHSALRMLHELTDEYNRALYINATPAGAVLSVKSNDLGGDFILDAECQGPLARIAFPAKNLLALVREFKKDETVLFRMPSAEGPCLITGDLHPGQETVLMPMKIVDDDWKPEEAEAV